MFCFICNRATDHFAEHDALVHAGLAEYRANGDVARTSSWDGDLAEILGQVAFAEYMARGYDGVDLDFVVAKSRELLTARQGGRRLAFPLDA